jgi:[phosphatase 2A protein]-leucine-carboxy methyltransferase
MNLLASQALRREILLECLRHGDEAVRVRVFGALHFHSIFTGFQEPMADHIPNLNTLRTGRGGPRLRGGRRGGRGPSSYADDGSTEPDNASKDRIIQQTDYDASSSRLSALELGYLTDPYARAFLKPGEQIPRRYPIINRGTYVRSTAIDKLVLRFLQAEPETRKQIISLGAGSDTRLLRLVGDHSGANGVVYHEMDFESNVAAKQAVLERSPALASRLQSIKDAGSSYHLHAVDLRDLPSSLPGLASDLPTLILSECCLCYMPPDQATTAISYFTTRITNSVGFVAYEPVRPFDAFGKTMVSNLASRGIHMQTLKRYSSLDAQRQRLRLAGFDKQGARDIHQIWDSQDWVPEAERERVERLEWLDEVEEWKLLASHYCVAWGWRGECLETAWSDIEGGRTSAEDRDDDMLG